MNICVAGLWHLGSVTAACLARAGCNVCGYDDSQDVVIGLSEGRAPLFEPGLNELVREEIDAKRLRFTSSAADAVSDASVLWVTYDTPVSEEDEADAGYVTSRVEKLVGLLSPGALVIVSSQLPVGTVRSLEQRCGRTDISFAALPENLRLGKAIEVFTKPDRVVAGVRNDRDRETILKIFSSITDRIEWMSVESAEMTKHAINAFLATSVVFINELATLCEQIGADAKEVERGLKSESRIGPKSYLSPGSAFAGGTLARDIAFLNALGTNTGVTTPLFGSIRASNESHKAWAHRKLLALFGGSLHGKTIGVWGLTYKPGTDTLRRSSSVALCHWLHSQGAAVVAHDPAVKSLPPELDGVITLRESAGEAARGVDALVVSTQWPEYREVAIDSSADLVVIDESRFLRERFDGKPRIRYFTIGKGLP